MKYASMSSSSGTFSVSRLAVSATGLALFQDLLPLLVQQGAFHRDLVVAQGHAVQHPALADEFRPGLQHPLIGLVPILPVGPDDQLPAGLGDVHPFVADGLPAGLIALAGINELDPPDMLRGLVLGDEPDVGGDAGVVETVVGKLHDGVQPVVFDQIPANLRLAGTGVPGEQGGAVLDDGHATLRLQFGQTVEPGTASARRSCWGGRDRSGQRNPSCAPPPRRASRFQSDGRKGGWKMQ